MNRMRIRPNRIACALRCFVASICCLGLAPCCNATAGASAPQPLRTLKAIHLLTNAEADQSLPVDFTATVTYYRASNRDLFMQDGKTAKIKHETSRSAIHR